MAKKKESKQKKINVRVDFTPMVDMLMLLITFFMLCTTLSKPQTMELTMPSNDDTTTDEQKNEAKASETVTIYVAANNKILYGEGIPQYDNPNWLKETTWGNDGIRKALREHATENGTKPVKRIELAVKELNSKKDKEKWSDEELRKRISDTSCQTCRDERNARFRNLEQNKCQNHEKSPHDDTYHIITQSEVNFVGSHRFFARLATQTSITEEAEQRLEQIVEITEQEERRRQNHQFGYRELDDIRNVEEIIKEYVATRFRQVEHVGGQPNAEQ